MSERAEAGGAFWSDADDAAARRRYRALAEAISEGVCRFDADGRVLAVNESVAETTGYAREELVGSHVSALLDADDAAAVERRLAGEFDCDDALELAVRTADGGRVPCELRLHLREDDGFPGAIGVFRRRRERGDDGGDHGCEEVERNRRERERLEDEREAVFGRVTDAFYALDDEWTFTHVNDRAEELIDYRGEGLVGENLWEVFEWAADSKLGEEYRTAMETQESTAFEFYYPEPLAAWYEVRAFPSETGLSVYFRDVTERREYERRLAESERRYRTLAEYFPNGLVTLFDHDLEYTLAAGQGFDDIPVEPADLEGEHFRRVWDEETADALEPVFEAALDGEERSVELAYAGREWVVHGVPITDDRGDVFAGMTMAQDVTEQKERERYLRDAKDQLEAATEAGAVGTWEWHVPDDEFVTGASFARTFGVDSEAAREGVPLDRIVASIHEDDRPRVEQAIEDAMQACGEYEEEYRVWNADDELRWVVARGHVECDDEGRPVRFPGALTDITERKRAEQKLERKQKQLETLFEVLPVGVVVAEEDGRLVEANETAREIWGGDVFDAATVADYARYRGWWVDTGEPVEADEWTMARVLRGEEVTEPDVYEIETAEGERRIVMAHGRPIRDDPGEVTRGVVAQTDITERKERERRLEESNERLERFASMLAHELRNPVTIGQIYSQQLPDEAAPDAVGYVTEAFDRIEDMIDVMLVLTRGREAIGESAPIRLADVARDAWEGVDAPEATLAVELDGVLEADETYVRHLFRNLFENAVEHGDADAIEVGRLPPTESDADGFYVADDGVGIPPEDRENVFETGFTTAANEGGTGLGLAFVAELADVYDWTCEVTESDAGGARFEFRNVDLVSE